MNHGESLGIRLAAVKLVKGAAQIAEGTVCPVQFVCHLHFQINPRMVVEGDIDIQNEFLVVDGLTKLDGVGDGDASDVFRT